MHAHNVRRVMGPSWRWLQRAALIAIGLQAFFLLCGVPAAWAVTQVVTLQVEREDSFAAQRVYAGTAVAKRASELGFRQSGEIASLGVDIGQRVTAGDVLARLDNRALKAARRQAQADVSFAQASLAAQQADTELATQTEQRYRDLKSKGHVSSQVYDETRLALVAKRAQLRVARASLARADAALAAAEIALSESRIVAPFDGVVQHRHRDEGSQVGPGQAVLRLVAVGELEAHVGIPASVAVSLKENMAFQVGWNGHSYPATLRAISPEIESATRTMTAVLELVDANIPLGAVVELSVQKNVTAAGFWVPVSALTESDRGLWGVYVVNAESVVERHLVEIVHTESDRAFVRGTLTANDRVISTGVQRVVPGQRVELMQATLAQN